MKPVNPSFPPLHMRFHVKDVPSSEIRLTTEIPSQYKAYVYPFCTAMLEISADVDVLHQVMQLNGFTISNHIFFARKDIVIEPFVSEPISTLHCMIRGSIKCAMGDLGVFWLRAGQFSFFRVNNVRHKAWLQKDNIYESFHIDFSREQLELLSPYSTVMQALLEKREQQEPAYLAPQAGIMHSRYYDLITDIRNAGVSHKMREIEMPANIALLLAIALMDIEESTPEVTETEEVKLFATISAYVLNNLGKELGNAAIARNYCISVSKLKQGFKKAYNESLQSFVRRTRLEAARDLILNTSLSLHKIAEKVGYVDYGNFSRRYRAYYGHPPSEVQRDV